MTNPSPKPENFDIANALQQTIDVEIAGLNDMKSSINPALIEAVETIARITEAGGRVVVAGIGKSGHVGNKIAATMASTGTPSFFVHPTEASHGDMGMITTDDCVLMLSRGGGSIELAEVIKYCKRFKIPLIAMTAKPDSDLGQAADIIIQLPDSPEACPIGMAPTTSTTQMITLGDAIAVTLMNMKGFAATEYKVFHPGGKLGARLKLVSELMHTGDALPLVKPDLPMSEALLIFTEKNMGSLGIVDDSNKLVGIITDGDLKRHMDANLLSKTCADIMTKNPKTIRQGALAEEALHIMNDKNITNLFVIDDEKPVGIIHIHDILRAGVA